MSGAVGASAAITAVINANKASGVIVSVDAQAFLSVVHRAENAVVVHTYGGFISKKHKYLTSYKGLAFYTKTEDPLNLPAGTERIEADKIWIPEM